MGVIWNMLLVLRGERGPTTRAPVEPDYAYGRDAGKPDKLGHTPFAAGPCVASGLGEERDVGDAQNCHGARVPAGRRSAGTNQQAPESNAGPLYRVTGGSKSSFPGEAGRGSNRIHQRNRSPTDHTILTNFTGARRM